MISSGHQIHGGTENEALDGSADPRQLPFRTNVTVSSLPKTKIIKIKKERGNDHV
jgi:hypothetical protein